MRPGRWPIWRSRLASAPPGPYPVVRPARPSGALTAQSAADAIGALLPDGANVIDEGVTSGGYVAAATAAGPRHDWLNVTGGAIGIGLPLAVGAAIAAPDRKIVGLQADGSSIDRKSTRLNSSHSSPSRMPSSA